MSIVRQIKFVFTVLRNFLTITLSLRIIFFPISVENPNDALSYSELPTMGSHLNLPHSFKKMGKSFK